MRNYSRLFSLYVGEPKRIRSLDLVLGANMPLKLTVALPLVVLVSFGYGLACWKTQRVELPCAIGTSPASEKLVFDPHHLAVRCEALAGD
jgi:hypothetical protein